METRTLSTSLQSLARAQNCSALRTNRPRTTAWPSIRQALLVLPTTINNMASNQANAASARGSPPRPNLAATHLQAAKEAQKKAVKKKMIAQPAYKGCYNQFTKWVDLQRCSQPTDIPAVIVTRIIEKLLLITAIY